MAMRDDHSIVEQVNVGQRNEWIPFLISVVRKSGTDGLSRIQAPSIAGNNILTVLFMTKPSYINQQTYALWRVVG
jgi:hypothetical protein